MADDPSLWYRRRQVISMTRAMFDITAVKRGRTAASRFSLLVA